MLNSIQIAGRMVKDPEYRVTQSQKPVTTFTLAVERDFARQGERREADFIDCIIFGNGADFVSQYFKKGNMAIVSGRLQSRDWTDRDNNKRRSWEVIASSVYFGEAKPKEQKTRFTEMPDDPELPFI